VPRPRRRRRRHAKPPLSAELHALKLPELRQRAAAAGISGNAIEEARDADEPKKEMIALIVGQQQGVHP
jgi:hypothetical protein